MTGNGHRCSPHDDGRESNELCSKDSEQIRKIWQEDGCSSECFLRVGSVCADFLVPFSTFPSLFASNFVGRYSSRDATSLNRRAVT